MGGESPGMWGSVKEGQQARLGEGYAGSRAMDSVNGEQQKPRGRGREYHFRSLKLSFPESSRKCHLLQ